MIIAIHTKLETGIGLISNKEIFQIMDMMIRSKIHDIVEVFYHSPFKIFYINSTDGKNFSKPTGLFVSLGITTSMKTLENLKNIILRETKYDARIVEISSKFYNGQYLNTVTNLNPPQYLDNSEDSMGREESLKKLEELKSLLQDNSNLEDYLKLTELIRKIDEMSGWEDHGIIKKSTYKIFHKKINYKKDGDLEYRIGIYII